MKPKSTFRRLLAFTASSLIAISSASALTYYWDSNNNTAGFGAANGTWAAPTVGTTTAGWSLNPAGTTATLGVDVTTATSDDLNFGSGLGSLGYTGTITISGTVDAGNLTTYSSRVINAGNNNLITLSGGTAINLAATSTINTVADDNIFTISTAITGAGTSLTKTGVGTLALGGTNTFAGQLTVAQGVLSIATINNNSTDGTLGNSANAVILGSTGNNGVLRYTTNAGANSDKAFTLATGGTGAFDVTANQTLTLNGAIGGGGRLYKSGIGTILTTVGNGYSGGTVVGAGTLSVGDSSSLGTNVNTNNITIRNSGRLLLAASSNIGANQSITLSSSSNNAAPASATGSGANAGGALAVLGLGYNGLPANLSQANTNGGVIAINGVTGYDQDLSTLLSGKNLFLGGIGNNSTFTGTLAVGAGSLYRLGGGGGTLTFNTENLFTGGNGVQVGSTSVNGTGTVAISESQNYTGATTVSQGTLTFSGANGSATGSSGFTLNGGRLFLDSSGTNNSNRIGAVAVNLSNGGELHLSGNAAGTTQTIGNLNLGAGFSIVNVQANTVASTLDAGTFSRATNSTALFRGTSLGQQTGAVGRVTIANPNDLTFVGTSTLNDAANGDTTTNVKIIPYLIGDTGTGTGNSFVTYDDTLGFRVLTTSQFTSSISANQNVRLTAAATGITSNTINSLVLSNAGTSTIADEATLTVTSGAILVQGGNALINLAGPSNTGILDFGSNTGYFTTISNLNVGARLTGSGGLVKSGAGQLLLNNVNNSFTGDIILNGGTLHTNAGGASTNGILGDADNNIVVNGNATWTVAPNQTYTRGITINNGAILSFGNNGTTTFTRNVTGSGGINITGGFSNNIVLSGTGNTFEGPILIAGGGTGNNEYRVSVASLTDSSTANGSIVFSTNYVTRAAGSQFEYTGATDLLLANRQIVLASALGSPSFGHQIRSAGAGTLSISKDIIVSTPIHQTLHLNGTNTGANTFSGKIVDGDGKVSLTKSQAGRWILSGANTYTGNTTITGGTLELADNAQLKFVLGSTSGSNNSLTGTAGTVVLDGDFVIDTSAADALASGSWTLENVSTLTGPYGSTFTVVGFTDEGDDTWTKDIGGGKTYTFDETTGILTLAATSGGDSAWDDWKTANDALGSNPDDDTDGDGVTNAVEFILGGTSGTNDLDLLPQVAASGTDMTFTFVRDEASVDVGVAVFIEVSNDLVIWDAGDSPYAVPDADTGGPVNPGVTVVDNGDTHTVTLTVAKAPDTKKFARLKVVITP